jgi:tetrathionate reductase subunit B
MSNKRLGMLIDLSLCIGCNACAVACKQENSIPLTKFNTWVESWDVKKGDNVYRANVPKQCNHCKDAPCVSVCPTTASHIDPETGIVLVDRDKCIGCKYCMVACPYSVRWVDDATGEVEKCTFCYHRTSQGLLPACVATCVTQARMFGDLNDPESDIAKRLAEVGGGEILLEELGENTALRYIGLKETEACERVSAIHKGGNVYKKYEGR